MKVLNIIEESRLGGPQLRIIKVADFLFHNYDITTHILSPKRFSSDFLSLSSSFGIPHSTINLNSISRSPFLLFLFFVSFPFDLLKMLFFIKKNKFSLIHISGGSWQWKGAICSIILRKKFIWHLNDTYMPKIILYIFKALSLKSSGFIFAGNSVLNFYKDYLPKLDDIPHAIIPAPINNFAPIQYKNTAKHPLRVGMLCNINKTKRVDRFVDAAYLLYKSFPHNFTFHVMGSISDNDYYSSLLKKVNCFGQCFTFHDFNSDVTDYLSNLDIFVCASDFEASPTSVWEAMYFGIPIVSTPVGDVEYHFSRSNSGLISEYSASSISDSILYLSRKPNLCKSFSRQSHVYSSFFSISSVSQQHLKLYSDVFNHV